MTTPIAAGPLDRRVGDQSYVTEDGPIVTGYDMGSPDGGYYCEMHYNKETGIFTVLNFGRQYDYNRAAITCAAAIRGGEDA